MQKLKIYLFSALFSVALFFFAKDRIQESLSDTETEEVSVALLLRALEDIPIHKGDKKVGEDKAYDKVVVISVGTHYFSESSREDVISYYKNVMPLFGWKLSSGWNGYEKIKFCKGVISLIIDSSLYENETRYTIDLTRTKYSQLDSYCAR